jgi:pimeloyl-ACP methyl ester carboxylesterase
MSGIPFIKYGTGSISVVLIHGFCEDRRIFDGILPHLDQKNFSWFLPDLPGFGEAAKLGMLEISMTGYADYIRDWILDQSKPSVILAGHSMGGYVALDFASHYPEQLKGLVLMHSQAAPDSMEKRRSRDEHIRFLEQHGMARYAAKLIPDLYTPDWKAANRELLDEWIDRASKYGQKGVMLALQCMRDRKDHRETLAGLKFPVGMIAGARDPLIPREVSLEESHLAANTSFHMLEEAGHMGMMETPEAFAEALQQCINQLTQIAV